MDGSTVRQMVGCVLLEQRKLTVEGKGKAIPLQALRVPAG
jgi:hypothetical protein